MSTRLSPEPLRLSTGLGVRAQEPSRLGPVNETAPASVTVIACRLARPNPCADEGSS